MDSAAPLSDEECFELLTAACQGDDHAASRLFGAFRDLVTGFVELRIDGPLRSRIGADDIWQETCLEATKRLGEFRDRRPMPFHVWLLKTAQKQIGRAREKHLVRQRRDARREVQLPDRSSIALARQLARFSSPSQQIMKQEQRQILADAIFGLEPTEREILLLRHMEQLDFRDIAEVLEISYPNARQRHVRALMTLRSACEQSGIDFGSLN